jgi:hypothetical protein
MKDLSHRFLCACFRGDGGEAWTLMQNAGWDWERLFAEASDEAMLPALYGRM